LTPYLPLLALDPNQSGTNEILGWVYYFAHLDSLRLRGALGFQLIDLPLGHVGGPLFTLRQVPMKLLL
jgi:hypothetical protein